MSDWEDTMVPDQEIVAAAIKHASLLDIRERALRLAQESWAQIPMTDGETILKRAERIEAWLGRAPGALMTKPEEV